MPPERWRRIEELYHAVRERTPGERDRFLREACAADDELRQRVQLLLEQDGREAYNQDSPTDPTLTAPAPGSQLGPYRIEGVLGRGGMGEVFRAVDTRLGRKVAIKVCPAEFSGRFAREGRAIAALNHPHICTLYDVGDNYLVMELIEGETLAGRIRKGPLPLDLVVRIGAQVADALSAAHALGIVHRDLKPGNIMITGSGVKVLDFGLARAPLDETLTETRHVVGTPAYMAPEQREGRQCDARTDIYALGLVLHEMATGERPAGALAPSLPPRLAHVIERCLADDAHARWQSAGDVKAELEWAALPEASPHRGRRRRWLMVAAAAVVLAGVILFAATKFSRRAPPAEAPVVRLAIPLPEEGVTADPPGLFGAPAISPDGKAVVVALGAGKSRAIWIRRFDAGRFERLAGTQGGNFPFWSPDSRQIGFFTSEGKLMKMPVSGGDPQTLCSFTPSSERGATWNASGTIVYGVNYEGLYRVSDGGGTPVKVAGLDPSLQENSLRNPAFLPDGVHFLCFSRTARLENRGLYLYTLDGSANRKKLAVTDQSIAAARDAPTGRTYALFSRSDKLWAQAIDSSQWELAGEPVSLDEDVGLFSASETGTLVYRRTDVEQGQYTWYDRTGRELGGVGASVDSWTVELSPDDRYAAINYHRSLDGHFSIWLIDTVRNVSSPFSVQTERSFGPVWSPDGARLYFTSKRSAFGFVKAVDDASPEQPFPAAGVSFLQDLSRDGKYLLGVTGMGHGGSILYTEFGKEAWRPLLRSEGVQRRARFSPDGRWVAYESSESGAPEVYVVDFPGAARKQRISVAGGKEPRWRRDSREIVYYSPEGALMSASFAGGNAAAQPVRLFKIRFSTDIDGFHYALSRDGQRILAMKEVGRERSRELNVLINWPRLLRRER